MPRECKNMPELHEPTLKLIQKVADVNQAGSGRIPLLDLMRMFPASLETEQEEKLRQRGDVALTKDTDSGGTFQNEGNEIAFSSGAIRIIVPSLVKGRYVSFPTNFNFTFDRDHTVFGKFLFFRVNLEDIQANQDRIDVDLSGDSHDQCIIHSSPR